ncbi:SDR family NAD(P)-dependent oxidoreductase [Lysobacter capsici]|uniref:SDR family NAD(P)-dependent oxidoreductase n=1 Tax=Lysobacter capsici TaxID=435897 RepID=UPI002079534F|nr:SDR family NAD(P)-dependent oxidoreductase [Lysobacter capsici]
MSSTAANAAGDERAPQTLAGRVVLVTGANGGLGSAAAGACADAGATVVLLGRKLPKLNKVYDAVAKRGPEPLLYPLDLEGAQPDDYAEMVARIDSELGRLDGVLHCAADFPGLTPLAQTDPAAFARAVHVNLTAPWWLSQACLPLLAKAPDAALVFALDDPQRVGQAYWGGYGAAQHGLAALVGMLHAELANSSIRVAGLRPGPMRTPLRARAYVEDSDRAARDPSAYALACVSLLSADGAVHRGQVWSPVP